MQSTLHTQSKFITDVNNLVIALLFNKIEIEALAIALNYLYPAMMYYDDSELNHTETFGYQLTPINFKLTPFFTPFPDIASHSYPNATH